MSALCNQIFHWPHPGRNEAPFLNTASGSSSLSARPVSTQKAIAKGGRSSFGGCPGASCRARGSVWPPCCRSSILCTGRTLTEERSTIPQRSRQQLFSFSSSSIHPEELDPHMALLLSKRHLTSKQACRSAAAPSRLLAGPILRKSAIVVRGSVLSRAMQPEEPHSQAGETSKFPAEPQASMQQHQEEKKTDLGSGSANGTTDAPPSNAPAAPIASNSADCNGKGMPQRVPIETGSHILEHGETYSQIAGLFDKWNAALVAGWAKNTKTQFGSAKDVIECFAQNAAVLPTLSDELKRGQDNIRDYFDRSQGQGTSFLARNPVGKIVPGQRVIKMIGTDVAIDQGLYVFQVDNSIDIEPSKRERVKSLARFTFLYKKQKDGNWKIANFHSSQQPDYVAERGLILQHLHRWFDALFDKEVLASGDSLANVEARAQRVADLYAPDAVLLATVSPLVRIGRKDIVDYMRFFTSLNPRGELLKDEKGQDIVDIKLLSPDASSIAGLYKFETNDGKGGRQQVFARFTFTYVRNKEGKWLITEHHSSAMPADGPKNGQSIKSPLAAKDLQHHEMVEF